MHGMKLGMLDFSDTSSKEESRLLQVRQRAELSPPGEWIVGLNLERESVPGRTGTKPARTR